MTADSIYLQLPSTSRGCLHLQPEDAPYCGNKEFTLEYEAKDWIQLAQDMDQWQTLVNTLMTFWVP
jgi:hypothetical protein